MSRLRRRHVLQLAGASLGVIGLNRLDFMRQGHLFNRALAETTGRKYALLVGINQYPNAIGNLSGCLNDVRLQYELLVHRYGFQPEDIVIVAEATLDLPAKAIITPPTRQAIIDAWRGHLGQAQPGDIVIFHYSGHGTFATEPNPISYPDELDINVGPLEAAPYDNFDGKTGAIVPFDVFNDVNPGEANLILGSTLFLLSYGLKTDNVTIVLDSCFSGGGVRGNLVYRAILETDDGKPIQASRVELDFQTALMAELGLSPSEAQNLRQRGNAKGVAMSASLANQLSAETTIAGFRSGIFTYLLTRYLWQSRSDRALEDVFLDLSRITKSESDKLGGSGQNPIYFVPPGSTLDNQPPYLLTPQAPAADAVVRDVKPDQTVEFWLGGMTPRGLEDAESIFEVIDKQGNVLGRVRQTHRSQLWGYGQPMGGVLVRPGMLMREQIRGIPADFSLRVGLHESLGDDKALARQVLAEYDRVIVVEVDGQTDSDYLLGRFKSGALRASELQGQGNRTDIQALETNSIGLFTKALIPLPTTFGNQSEEMEAALERLATRFRLLLASQALKAILSTNTSDLKLSVEVASYQRGGVGVVQSRGREASLRSQVVQLQVGEEMYLRVTNNESRSLYVAVIAAGRDGNMHVYHPSYWEAPELEAELSSGDNIVIPKRDDNFCLPVSSPAGFFEVLVIASTEQLRDTLRSLKRISDRSFGSRGQQISFTPNDERSRSFDGSALSLVDSILGDLSRSARATPRLQGEQYNVQTSQLAALAVGIEVVEANIELTQCQPYATPF
ncbi:MAG: caspase family protein [Cyanobacteria bacterium P01_F01_bin.56]